MFFEYVIYVVMLPCYVRSYNVVFVQGNVIYHCIRIKSTYWTSKVVREPFIDTLRVEMVHAF